MRGRLTRRALTLSALLAVAAMLTATDAQATPLDFNLSYNSYILASWEQDSNPVPVESSSGFSTEIAVTDGEDFSGPFSDIIFYASGAEAETFLIPAVISTSGPQLYSGTEAAPVFAPGTYALEDATLTVTGPDDSTPTSEPEGFAILASALGGFVILRRGRRMASAPR